MNHPIYVIGAYGRKYETREQIEADWHANKDFRIVQPGICGTYLSKSTFSKQGNPLDFVVYHGNNVLVTFWHPKYLPERA